MTDPRPLTVVTGGGRGIGAATADLLARRGHDLVLGYHRDAEHAETVAQRCRGHGARVLTVRADVADPAQVDELFPAAAAAGRVTGLVANAGLTAHIGPLVDTPVDTVRRVLDVNLLGAVLCDRAAIALMARGSGGAGGAIVNVSSSAASIGSPGEYVHYAAAKAGVDALTVGLSKEVASEGIRVNAVAPGLVRTDIHAGAGHPERVETARGRIPFGRAGEPDEIAGAIAWLLDDEAGYVTGAVLRVAGGL